MSRREIPLREARAQIGHLVDLAEHYGETVVITRHGHPAAMLVPYAEEPTVTTEYALCWEAPGDGEDAWVIRSRSPKFPDWDQMAVHPELGKDDEEKAKAWAVDRITSDGGKVTGWHRDPHGDLIPEND